MHSAEPSSFSFLAPYGPLYLRLATVAERALAVDPSLTLVSLRQLAEALTAASLERIPLPLPPLNEQRRIVAKLDAIFEQTRAAKARLERLPALLEKLKRSILAAAFRGDLTKDWRAAHPDVEPASALLDRIRAERRHSWEADLRAKGKDPAKAKYEEPRAAGDGDVPELPSSWTWLSAEQCAWEITVGHLGPMKDRYVNSGIPFLRSSIEWRLPSSETSDALRIWNKPR